MQVPSSALGIVMLVLAALGIVCAVFLLPRKSADDDLYPKGYFLARGLGAGVVIGIALGAALGISMALGPVMGVALGAAIGLSLEARNAERIRPLTESERRDQRLAILIGVVILVVETIAVIWKTSTS